jgi:hypothetical protein
LPFFIFAIFHDAAPARASARVRRFSFSIAHFRLRHADATPPLPPIIFAAAAVFADITP